MTDFSAPAPSDIYPGRIDPLPLPSRTAPTLFVVIDTEEEFAWDRPFSRACTSVAHLQHLDRVQALFDRFRVRPTYTIDYPVATQPIGYAPLKELVNSGRCTIGVHIHPWVTPPFDESVTGPNSFIGNLAPALQRAKIQAVTTAIETNLGVQARVFKAGRYGIGRETTRLLEELDFDVDQSIMPHYDFSDEHGPSFRNFDANPFLFGERRRLLALPCTAAYVGAAGRAAPAIWNLAQSPAVRPLRLAGVVTRLRIADRLMLSPEGYSDRDLRRVADALLARGLSTLTFTFHSPSIEPGHTPYVRDARQLQQFLSRIEAFFDYFFGALSGRTTTPEEFRRALLDDPAATGLRPKESA